MNTDFQGFVDLWALVAAFFQNPATLTLFTLCVLDLVTGSLAALKRGEWSWLIFGTWYERNVVPYVGGYVVPFVITRLGLPDFGGFGTVAGGAAALPAVGALAFSIKRNVEELLSLKPGTLDEPVPSDAEGPPPAA